MMNFHFNPVNGKELKKTRIFFVDDDEQNRKLMKRFLELHGYEVSIFETGKICETDEDGKCMLGGDNRCTDIIISDLQMPVISGVELVERLISNKCRCPNIALVSGGWSSDKILKAKSFNCRIFEKPFEFDDLLGWIRECEGKMNVKCESRMAMAEGI